MQHGGGRDGVDPTGHNVQHALCDVVRASDAGVGAAGTLPLLVVLRGHRDDTQVLGGSELDDVAVTGSDGAGDGRR